MADVAPLRRFIQVEETDFRSAVSESLLQKVGGVTNFINRFQHGERGFYANGPYGVISGAQTGVDGLWVIPFDVTLIGVIAFNLVSGSSGTTTMDLHRFTAPNTDAGTVFGTKPSLTSASANTSYVGIITDNAGGYTAIGGGTGMTAPTLAVTDLDQGDALRFDLDARMTGGQNAGLLVYFRPR